MVVFREAKTLTDAEISSLTSLLVDAFEHDPIARRLAGVEQRENRELWRVSYADELLKGLRIGRIYVAQAENSDYVGCAITFGPGVLQSDVASTLSKQEMDVSLPAEQKEFFSKLDELQKADYAKVYPPNFEKDNLFIWEFAVAVGHQRRGIGSQLLKYIIGQTEPDVSIVLNTSKGDNVLFYQSNGFELKSSFDMDHWRFGPVPKLYTLAYTPAPKAELGK